jgi:hypothetical protein
MLGELRSSPIILTTKGGKAFKKRYFATQWKATEAAEITDLHFNDLPHRCHAAFGSWKHNPAGSLGDWTPLEDRHEHSGKISGSHTRPFGCGDHQF